MYLALRTDAPDVTLAVVSSEGTVLKSERWSAGRQLSDDLLAHLRELLKSLGKSWQDLEGVIVFRGPGSFTGLRIGITVGNTIAYAGEIPVVGQLNENWMEDGAKRLKAGENDGQVLPFYGAEPNITKPKR